MVTMLEIKRNFSIFKRKDIWFADYPFDVIGYDSVIFYECNNKIDIKGFNCSEFSTIIIDLTQDLDVLWKNMSKSSCRYAINRAIKDKINIKRNEDYDEFIAIDRSFRKNKKLGTSFIAIDFMKEYGTLFTAEFNGEVLCGHLYIKDQNTIRWLIGSSKRLDVTKEQATLIGNANRLILWEAIKYAKELGYKEFDLGGYYNGFKKDNNLENINKFKLSYGGNIVTKYNYEKNYSNIYNLAYRLYNSLHNLTDLL